MVLGVNMKETPEQVKAYVEKRGLTFRHLLDGKSRLTSAMAVPAAPTTVLVDREGKVLAGALGYRDWASPAAMQVVESVLK